MARHQTNDERMDSNVMIDIETLGTDPGSVIIAIGVCEFGPDGLGEREQISVSADSCQCYGLETDPDTVDWWKEQPEQARQQLKGGKTLPDALDTLAKFCDCDRDQLIWANSPAFDIVLLEEAYDRIDRNPPWAFWNTRDMRTVRDILDWTDLELGVPPDAPEVEHHALHDAIAQAAKTQQALKIYREGSSYD